MRNPGIVGAWIGAALAASILVAAILDIGRYFAPEDRSLPAISGIGGPFALVDHRGKPVTDKDYLGKPMLVFFGFTRCPDVCPTALLEMTNWLKELGPAADSLNVLFVTVDPERDTPEQLALYLSSFDSRITGLSGSGQDVASIMKAYRAYGQKVPTENGDYTMDHTASVYMINRHGQFVGLLGYQEPPSDARAKLRRLLQI